MHSEVRRESTNDERQGSTRSMMMLSASPVRVTMRRDDLRVCGHGRVDRRIKCHANRPREPTATPTTFKPFLGY